MLEKTMHILSKYMQTSKWKGWTKAFVSAHKVLMNPPAPYTKPSMMLVAIATISRWEVNYSG